MTNPNSAPSEVSNVEEKEEGTINPESEAKKKSFSPWWVVGALAFLAILGGGGTLLFNGNENGGDRTGAMAGQPQASPVKLQTLEPEIVQDSSTIVGRLDAPRAVTVRSEINGRIRSILVAEGERVSAGEIIARVESDQLEAELNQAQAQLESVRSRLALLRAGNRPEEIAQAQAQLNGAIARLNNARQGARPEEIAEIQAQLDSARAELELAQERTRRYRVLFEEGAISQDEFDEFVTEERQAQASVNQAQRRLDAQRKGRDSDLNALQADVEQARQNLQLLRNGTRQEEIAQAEAEVSQASARVNTVEVQIEKAQIIAPFTGIVGDIPVKVGDFVTAGDSLTTITENDLLEANLSIPLEEANRLQLGLPVEIINNQGEILTTGEISFIAPQVNTNSQLVLTKATLNPSQNNLFNQTSIRARIIWQESLGIVVPSAAVSRMGGNNFVFVAESAENPQGEEPSLIAQQRPVQLGDLQGNNYEVIEGLEEGEQIVSAGILNLQDGSPIMPLPPEQNGEMPQ
ncbi:efflux RND transporter periplasmic adaptor subunit [Cyanobacterium stanieri LEGE 03274]|uniref:Efflux RND transporter periplasmic adaptor subunit n=1 Tax=Cyanobacterium stanieri LEGE 03274 TaxID=1828756 RepID=A0ABR9V4P1_9CHRO|nr:efflux RND transporter periplasmic adaptor subunit [Cyanobacterium stanieri]MBE9222855.1 efflux RND transporter periplasmic adaptor subunit [Cyanobacterium stanieri LEGE 03274]